MSRQDDVREEVFATLVDSQRLTLEECGDVADIILEGISGLGVVIKTDGELPDNFYKTTRHNPRYRTIINEAQVETAKHWAYDHAQRDMLKARYTQTIPLIEEEK